MIKSKRVLFFLLAVSLLSCSNKDPKSIFNKSKKKLNSISSGFYEMEYSIKHLSNNDTAFTSYRCLFRKDYYDTNYSFYFHNKIYVNNIYKTETLYNGLNKINFSIEDSVGRIKSANELRQVDPIQKEFYLPILNKDNFPLPKDLIFIKKIALCEYIGKELIDEEMCYHLKLNFIPDSVSVDNIQVLNAENNYWISISDLIPIKLTIEHKVILNGDTMNQFERFILRNCNFDDEISKEYFINEAIPDYIKIKNIDNKKKELLPIKSKAPDFNSYTLEGDSFILSKADNDLLIVDFFYKSCYPCNLAIPGLISLQNKYQGRGLKVIGINPYDTVKNEVKRFIDKKKINYQIIIDSNKKIVNKYNVTGYPTLYIINKNGEIIFNQSGFNEQLEQKLDSIIKSNLF